MPLFKCPKCGCIENTALGEYMFKDPPEETLRDERGRVVEWCSECATGMWHGKFPKQTPEEAGFVLLKDERGYYGPPGG